VSESKEVLAARQYMKDSGTPHRVTDVDTPGVHTKTSLHYADGTDGHGRGIDFAGLRPGRDTPEMLAIYRALEPIGPQVAELFYAGPGGGFWKNGRRIAASPGLRDGHHNHVHLGLVRGTFVRWPGAISQPAVVVPKNGPVHDYEEAQVKSQLMFVQLDDQGNGYSDWQLNLGRDPIPVSAVQQGPSPPDDGYWLHQAKVNLAMQPRGGVLRVVARGGTPKDTVGVYISCA
jgi:hypothetical protein